MIARSRALFAVAVIVSIVIVSTEFPLGQLTHARAAAATASLQLSRLKAENRLLASEVASLHRDASIASIAHREYGLVSKGDQSVIVLPSTGAKATAASGPLGPNMIPKADIFPSDAIVASGSSPSAKAVKPQSYWARLLQRLEFWKAVP
ncbi:MAG: septum formation initiator family protein [Actinomycetota bacterium]|jgi:cell division protein FtsB|nr:septum formation initiator family protein [Actinomycetota bacterium]